MPVFSMAGVPSALTMTVVFVAGALVVWAVAALLRAGLTALLERGGHRLDRWRRVWFHPERELARLLEALLIVAFVAEFVRHYDLPGWTTPLVAAVWALHLPADLWSWLRLRRQPRGTRQLHERGFLLLDLGPVGLRGAVVLAGGGGARASCTSAASCCSTWGPCGCGRRCCCWPPDSTFSLPSARPWVE